MNTKEPNRTGYVNMFVCRQGAERPDGRMRCVGAGRCGRREGVASNGVGRVANERADGNQKPKTMGQEEITVNMRQKSIVCGCLFLKN